MRVLVVEDQKRLAGVIMDMLKANGFVADPAYSLNEATDAAAVTQYDAILLDRALPDGDGLDWLRTQRKRGVCVPVLFMSAEHAGVDDRVDGLNAGADDYVVKPFNMDEFVARLRAVLRRPSSALEPVLRAGNLEFDPASRQVWVGTTEVHVPRREACLLEVLLRRFGRVVPRAALEESLYSFNDEVTANAIEVGVYRLRAHLGGAGATVNIRTARGVGYVLEDGPAGEGEAEDVAEVKPGPVPRRPKRANGPVLPPDNTH